MTIIKIKPIALSLICTLSLGLQVVHAKTELDADKYPTLDALFNTEQPKNTTVSSNTVTNAEQSEDTTVSVYTSATAETSANNSFPQLEAHIKNQQFGQAYKRVIDLRDYNEGNPRFDYLSGISALETGHFGEAIFILERVTANNPSVIRPHLELARAYLKDNNNKAAIDEFKTVLTLNPPEAVKKKVKKYLAAIKKGGRGINETIITGLASFSIGYDDNVNLGFAEKEINLPVFGNVELNPSSVKQGSGFAETQLQLKYRKAQSKRSQNTASIGLTNRLYFSNPDFNTTSFDLRAGHIIKGEKNKYQLMLRDRPVILGGESYSNTIGIDALLQRNIGSGHTLSTGLSLEKYKYIKDAEHDRKRAVLSTRLDKISKDYLQQFSAYGGTELPDDDAGKEYSRDMLGLGYHVVRPWNKKQRSFMKFNYQHNEHQAPQALYQQERKDDEVSVEIGHQTRISDNWKLNTSLKHIDKNSNLELFDASRNELKLGVQYDWN